MKATSQNVTHKHRALGVVLAFLFGATFAPVALATQSDPQVCAMACCVTEGHCCCKPAKPSVKGQKHDRNETQFVNVELSKPCSEDCAASRFTSHPFSRALAQPASRQFDFMTAAAIHGPPFAPHQDSLDQIPSSPRAPPSLRFRLSA